MFTSNIKMWENVILVTLWHHGLYPIAWFENYRNCRFSKIFLLHTTTSKCLHRMAQRIKHKTFSEQDFREQKCLVAKRDQIKNCQTG